MDPLAGHGEPVYANTDGVAHGVGYGRPHRVQRALGEALGTKGACRLRVFDNFNHKLLRNVEGSGNEISGKGGVDHPLFYPYLLHQGRSQAQRR